MFTKKFATETSYYHPYFLRVYRRFLKVESYFAEILSTVLVSTLKYNVSSIRTLDLEFRLYLSFYSKSGLVNFYFLTIVKAK